MGFYELWDYIHRILTLTGHAHCQKGANVEWRDILHAMRTHMYMHEKNSVDCETVKHLSMCSLDKYTRWMQKCTHTFSFHAFFKALAGVKKSAFETQRGDQTKATVDAFVHRKSTSIITQAILLLSLRLRRFRYFTSHSSPYSTCTGPLPHSTRSHVDSRS